ncbi:MAG: prephenate dehydrogenase/arogenate dehydrogenase family protein [Desulfovibrio sp.]|nr:prephenate dehydrogenase/arogenate dehydrogenase family protein [Desulfovibrio sp.]
MAVPAKTLLIGGSGRMAQMLATRARERNLAVSAVDRPFAADVMKKETCGVTFALFCVPALVLKKVLRTVCPFLPKACIVADITSVKEMPVSVMEEVWEGPVVGTHPLFGPKPDDSGPLPVVLTPGKKATEGALLTTEEFFCSLGFQTFRCTPSRHDEAMANIQNLNFITTLAYFALLANREDLLPFLTPSFHRRMTAAKKMLTEDASMFSGLFEANPHSHEIVRRYRQILNVAASGDIEVLCQRARWWWKDGDRT